MSENKKSVPFQVWLARSIRPIFWTFGLAMVFLSCLTLAASIKLNIKKQREAFLGWARTAEVLAGRHDIAALNSISEFFIGEYPGSSLAVLQQGKLLWSFPITDTADVLSEDKSLGAVILRQNIDLGGDATALVHLPMRTFFVDSITISSVFAAIIGLFTLLLSLIGRRWQKRFLLQLEAMETGETAEVLEIQSVIDRMLEWKTKTATVEMASQIAHDIRSPATVLSVLADDLDGLPPDSQQVVRSAVNRIQEIADRLLENKTYSSINHINAASQSSACEKVSLLDLINDVFQEKRIQFNSRKGVVIALQVDASSADCSAYVNPAEFKVLLSNILNNAYEAIHEDAGRIAVRVSSDVDGVMIKIKDSGTGIPSGIINLLTVKGASFGKKNGHGLGLYHAKKSVELWGGSLRIESDGQTGAEIIIVLRR